jgi:hypothetical protein
VLEHSSYTKVTQFDNTLLGHKHILTLDVSMKNLSIVHMFHAKTNLSEPIEDLALGKVSTFLLLNFCSEIATVGVVHNDAEMPLLSFI